MEFGFSRFLEMFEERFGRAVTTAILGLVGAALALYCTKVVIEAAVYFYRLILSINFLAALRQESVAAHLLIFGVQIALTSLVLRWIWRRLYSRYLSRTETKLRRTLKDIEDKTDNFAQQVEAFEQREDQLKTRMDALKERQEDLLNKIGKQP